MAEQKLNHPQHIYTASSLLHDLLDFLFPKQCLLCHRYGHYLCANCFDQIKYLDQQTCPVCQNNSLDGQTHPKCLTPHSLDGVISAVQYQGTLRTLWKKIKYPPHIYQAYEEIDQIIRRFYTGLETTLPHNSILVPIPLHPSKKRRRGFNQSLLIAQSLAQIWPFPLKTNLLLRTKKGQSQVQLGKENRLKNARAVFALNKKEWQKGQNPPIILVDDIMTTGATLKCCGQIFKRNGAPQVWGITLAQEK